MHGLRICGNHVKGPIKTNPFVGLWLMLSLALHLAWETLHPPHTLRLIRKLGAGLQS